MTKEQGDLLARVLDMTETELRATLLTIIHELNKKYHTLDYPNFISEAIDAAYNPIRRTGVRF
jgi:hypothetical protein